MSRGRLFGFAGDRSQSDCEGRASGHPDAEEWLAAMLALLLVAEHDGPTMFARIGLMRALNRHVERVFDTSRKFRIIAASILTADHFGNCPVCGACRHARPCPNTGACSRRGD
jgi:hypothetical protein